MRRAGTVTFFIDLGAMLVVVMDDQGGGMFIQGGSTVSLSQGSYTSCSAEMVGHAVGLIGAEASTILSVTSPLTPAAPAALALGLVGRCGGAMTMSLSLSLSTLPLPPHVVCV